MSVIIGIMIGATVATVVRYFEAPQTTPMSGFIAVVLTAFACFGAALVMLAEPWPNEERYLIRLIWLLGFVYGGMTFTWLAGRFIHDPADLKNPVITMLIAVLSFQGLALVLVSFFLRQHSTGWREGFGLDVQPGHALLIGAGMGIVALYPVLRLNELCFYLFDRLTLHPQEQQTVEILRHAESLFGRIASGIATILIAPVGEEIIFRGILYPWAKRRFSQPLALWGTAILFGAIHLNLSSFLPLTLLAVLLVWLYEFTGNLLAPIMVHCIFNGVNFILLFYQQK
jgi:membrane protease YdiL (CAAX protease family)